VLRKIAYFLQLIDEEPRISLSNIAFLVILGKIIMSAQVDWPALVTLSITCLNLMHDRQSNLSTLPSVQDLTDKMTNLEKVVVEIKSRV
jgi:hypothetical protein